MPRKQKHNTKASWDPKNVFSGTAWFYARYRPGYSNEVINMFREKFGLSKKSRVLDLGCGTGQIALSVAPYVSEVIAVDPQDDMLKEGQDLAGTKKVTNVRWVLGESNDLPSMSATIGNIDLTVIARAFHWMDREQTLKDLYTTTKTDGGVAIIQDSGPRDGPLLPWKEIIDQTVRYWLGEERKAGTEGTYSHPTKRFETVLQESEFRDIELTEFNVERSWSIDQIIGYLYSASFSSLPVLREKKEAFEVDVRKRLGELEPTGQFKEQVRIEVMMVWKRLP